MLELPVITSQLFRALPAIVSWILGKHRLMNNRKKKASDIIINRIQSRQSYSRDLMYNNFFCFKYKTW